MKNEREATLFRNGRNQAVRIPREFEFPEGRVVLRKVGRRLIIEPALRPALADVLTDLKPLPAADTFPEVDDLPALDEDPLG